MATFRNLLSKPETPAEQQKNAVMLIQKKVHLQVSVLKDQELEDDELADDTNFVYTQLETTLQVCSGFLLCGNGEFRIIYGIQHTAYSR